MAIEDFYEPFYVQSQTSYEDEFGWPAWRWVDGARVNAGIILNTSTEAFIAEAQGVKALYTLIVDPRAKIEFHDVLRREKDGSYYRITGTPTDDMPPEMATVKFLRVSVEKTVKPE